MADALYAEYDSPDALVAAIGEMRGRGYSRLDAYTPYPIEHVREALGKARSRLPIAIFIGGILGASGAYCLQWLLVGYLYPLDVGGRPPHMPLAFVIITFEMGILLASFTAFFGVLFKARLLRLWDPVFEVDGFQSSSIDHHWLRVSSRDPRFALEATADHLTATGAVRVLRSGATEASGGAA